MKQVSIVSLLLVFMAIIILAAGCQWPNEKQSAVVADIPVATDADSGPNDLTVVWKVSPLIKADCTVAFYKADGGCYLTEQHHEIWPEDDAIRISAKEPEGEFIWGLWKQDFQILAGARQMEDLPITVCDRYFARVILNIITGAVPDGEESGYTPAKLEPVRIEGQWYDPVKIEADEHRQIFYRNRDSGVVDMVWLAVPDKQVFLSARGYNYRLFEPIAGSLPAKIEIFKTDAKQVPQQRLVQIDYYAIKSPEKQ